jgi:hypothetical protein
MSTLERVVDALKRSGIVFTDDSVRRSAHS